MSLETLLILLLIMQVLGPSFFARFETEHPGWRKALKWSIIHGGTIGLYYVVEGWAILFPLTILAMGLTVHFVICAKYGFHPFYATPRKKYYEFRGWAWPE